MPRPTKPSVVPARTLAQVYRRFGELGAAEASPLYARVAVALSESEEALRAIETAPARKRHPTVILAALHDLTLAGRAPALAAADGTTGAIRSRTSSRAWSAATARLRGTKNSVCSSTPVLGVNSGRKWGS